MPGSSRAIPIFPIRFLRKLAALLKIAFKQAPEANYHLSYLPKLAPWLFAYLRHSTGEAMFDFAEKMRPLFAASIAEHEQLMREAGAERYLRTNGWLKVYRTTKAFDAAKPDLDAIAAAGLAFEPLDLNGSLALEPGLSPVFERGIFWPQAASVSNPLAVTRAYADLFRSLGGVIAARRCTLAAPCRWSLARRYPGRTGRCAERGGRARTLGNRCAGPARTFICRWRSSAAITAISARRATRA